MGRLALIMTLALALSSAHAKDPQTSLNLAAPHWCPFSCDPQLTDGKRGILVDYLTAVFEKHRIKLKITLVPWSRAIIGAEHGDYDGLVSAIPAEAPSLLYPKTPTADYANCFFVNDKNKYWHYYDVKSLEEIHLAYLKDYGYEKPILDYLKNKKNQKRTMEVSGSNGVTRMIRLLEVGRVDAFIEERWVAQWEIKNTQGLVRKNLHQASCMPGTPFFTPINPNIPRAKEIIRILNNELARQENKNLLKKLVKQYLQ